MNSSIDTSDHYALVSSKEFTERMDQRWSQGLYLSSSPALKTLWGIMADTFRTATINSINGVAASPWSILQPPTGSGKTRGACVFAAMQADANAQGDLKPVGALIVTRLITQANEMAQEINELAGRTVATAHHSDKPATPEELLASDILIVTHQAYVNSVGHSGSHKNALRSRFVSWRGGTRLLTVIDEALGNVVENNKVTMANLAQVISYVTPEMRHEHPEQLRVLEELHGILVSHANPQLETQSLKMLWDNDTPAIQLPDMSALQRAMKSLPYDTIVLGELNDKYRDRIARRVRDIIEQSEAVMDQWAYYTKKGNDHSINSAAFLIPWNVPGPVVLDATASNNFLWDLFGPMHRIVPTHSHVRNYSTVTLHVARGVGVGKTTMVKKVKGRFPRLLRSLKKELAPERSVFLCMHQDAEQVAKDIALSGAHPFARLDVGHWGAVDGRNDWASYDTAVIFGLPYRDPVWSTNQFFALQGPQDDEWLKNPVWNQYENVRLVMQQRQLSVSIIQAINRVCCRRVIDAEGRCPPADIFIVLPKDKTGDAILQDIRSDMPGLNVVAWDFELDGLKARSPRKGTSHEALIAFMATRPPGETAMSTVKSALDLSPKKLKNLKEALRKPEHPTPTALQKLGIGYVVRGAGSASKSFLIKAQAA
jgi:hypothetical protein